MAGAVLLPPLASLKGALEPIVTSVARLIYALPQILVAILSYANLPFGAYCQQFSCPLLSHAIDEGFCVGILAVAVNR